MSSLGKRGRDDPHSSSDSENLIRPLDKPVYYAKQEQKELTNIQIAEIKNLGSAEEKV